MTETTKNSLDEQIRILLDTKNPIKYKIEWSKNDKTITLDLIAIYVNSEGKN